MPALSGSRILVVEDESILRDMLVDELREYGATVTGAENAAVAFQLLQSEPFDIVISDIKMPGEDGIALCERITRHFPKPPKLFLSTGMHTDDLDLARLGIVAVVYKPYRWKDIVEQIAAALGRT